MPKRHQDCLAQGPRLKTPTAEVQQSEKTVERARSVQCAVRKAQRFLEVPRKLTW